MRPGCLRPALESISLASGYVVIGILALEAVLRERIPELVLTVVDSWIFPIVLVVYTWAAALRLILWLRERI